MQSPRPRSLGLLRGEVVKQAENNGTAMPTLPRLSVNSQSPNNCQGFILHRSLLPLHRFSLRRGVSLSVCLCRNAENATWATVDHCPSEQRCRLLWTDRWFNFRISLLLRHSALNAIHAKQIRPPKISFCMRLTLRNIGGP